MENGESNQGVRQKVFLPTEKNFIKSMPRSLRHTKEMSKEEIKRIKTEMTYAKEEYTKRLSYLKDRIQTEKNKVLLQKEKMKNPEKSYQDYIKQSKEHLSNYDCIIDESVWNNEVKQ